MNDAVFFFAGIFVEAARRLLHPTEVHTGGTVVIAMIGLTAESPARCLDNRRV